MGSGWDVVGSGGVWFGCGRVGVVSGFQWTNPTEPRCIGFLIYSIYPYVDLTR